MNLRSHTLIIHMPIYCGNKLFIEKFTPGNKKTSNDTTNFLHKVRQLTCTLYVQYTPNVQKYDQ